MHRGGGAFDRGSRGGGAGGQGNFRRDHQTNGHRNYGPSEYGNYMEPSRDGHHSSNVADAASMKYEHARQNGNSAKHEIAGQAPANGTGRGGRGNGGNHGADHGRSGADCTLTQAEIDGLEKKIAGIHTDMNQAINAITSKENEKFDLIFSILIELQKRQAQLEDSVRSLKVQLGGQNVNGAAPNTANNSSQGGSSHGQPHSQGQQQMQYGNSSASPFVGPNGQMAGNQMAGNQMPGNQMASNQMGNQMGSQMGGQMGQNGNHGAQMNGQGNAQMNGPMGGQMFMGGGQMPMGQQYGNMVSADGSQAFYTNMTNVVLVASPTNMQQMQYCSPQMMSPTGPMQGMPQQMAMQFVGQDQPSEGGFQWTGNNEAPADNIIPTTSPDPVPNGTAITGQSDSFKEGVLSGSAEGVTDQEQHTVGDESPKAEVKIEEE